MKLNGAPLTSDASIRDFQGGMAGYIAHPVEQTLLLPQDIANLKSMRQHEVFLGLKRDLSHANCFNLSLFFSIFFFKISSSFSSHLQSRGDGELLPSKSERGRREEDSSCGCLPSG